MRWLLPIYDVSGAQRRMVAVVQMGISPERFLFPVIQAWPTSSRVAKPCWCARRETAVFMNELRHRSGTAMRLRLPLSDDFLPAAVALRASAPGQVQGRDHRNVPVLAAYRPVAGTDWHVVAKVDRAEVLEPVHVLAWWVGAVATLAVAALALVLGLSGDSCSSAQRLEMLVQKARSDQLMEQFFALPFIGIATGDLSHARWGGSTGISAALWAMVRSRWKPGVGRSGQCNRSGAGSGGVDRLVRGEIEVYAVDRRIRRGDDSEAFVSVQLRARAGGRASNASWRCRTSPAGTRMNAGSSASRGCMPRSAPVTRPSCSAIRRRRCSCGSARQRCPWGMHLAWIGMLEPGTGRLQVVASDGDGASAPGVSLMPPTVWVCRVWGAPGTALRENREIWLNDVPRHDPRQLFRCTGRTRWYGCLC